MKDNQRIIIGDRIMTRRELFIEKEKFRKIQANLSFEEKIKALIDLQKIAYAWGRKKDIIVWV
jgi:hypothetical protein